jgi:hypothetical protein
MFHSFLGEFSEGEVETLILGGFLLAPAEGFAFSLSVFLGVYSTMRETRRFEGQAANEGLSRQTRAQRCCFVAVIEIVCCPQRSVRGGVARLVMGIRDIFDLFERNLLTNNLPHCLLQH